MMACDRKRRAKKENNAGVTALNGTHLNIGHKRQSNGRSLRLFSDSDKWVTLFAVASLIVFTTLFTGAKAFNSDTHLTELRPRVTFKQGELSIQSFPGNKSHPDHFRLLQRDGDYILIGARNIVFNISIVDLSEDFDSRIVWPSQEIDSDMCFSKGKSEDECQNYIRVLVKKDEGQFLVCGTNAYKPSCRDYSFHDNGTVTYTEENGQGKCPYGPRHNSTFVYADGELYSGTVADFQGTIPLIFRDPLKTNINDLKILNAPDFVHSFEYEDFVFFFLRETAVEFQNCGKSVFSRVARVCKNDQGGEVGRNVWTSFLKSRLNCSIPGEFPFYFDEIHSTTDVIEGTYAGSSESIVYAIFSTPPNSIPGSAVCAFSMRDIMASFDGLFKQQETITSNWLPIFDNKVPEPRPGSCVNNSKSLPIDNLNFIRKHPLMDQAVPNFYSRPLLTVASFEGHRLNKLTVDPQVPLLTSGNVDVLFIATDAGVILKAINVKATTSRRDVKTVIIEEINLFTNATHIANLQLAQQTTGDTKLVIITDDSVTAIPLQRCYKAQTCGGCVGIQDPYCAWFEGAGKCAPAHSDLPGPVFQNVTSGVHYQCPKSGENTIVHREESSAPVAVEAGKIPPECPPASPPSAPPVCPPCMCSSGLSPPLPSPYYTTAGETKIVAAVEPLFVEHQQATSTNVEGQGDLVALLPPLLGPNHNAIDKSTPREGRVIAQTEQQEGVSKPPEIAMADTGSVIAASTMEGAPVYSAETLVIAITTACVASLVLGFIAGFVLSRKCRGDEGSHTPYLDSKMNKGDSLVQCAESNMYSTNTPTKNNLFINYNQKNVNNGKANATTTDVKPAKCAYI